MIMMACVTGMQRVQFSSATNAPLTDDHVRSRSESEDVTRFTFLEFSAADFVYCHLQFIRRAAQFKR
jgi:hypothetical protein